MANDALNSTQESANAFKDSDSGFLGGGHVHTEEWRLFASRGNMADVGEWGSLGPAVDDNNVNTCVKDPSAAVGPDGLPVCTSGSLSGAMDGSAAARRSAERLAFHKANAGEDIEDPDGIGRRIT